MSRGTWVAAALLVSLLACDQPTQRSWDPADPSLDAAPGPQPAFVGVIEARHSGSRELAVTYWIGSQRIRRETAPIKRDGLPGPATAGVIVDLASDRVVLYRASLDGRASVRLSLAQYSDFLDDNSDRWTLRQHGIGAIFVGLSKGEYRHDAEPDFEKVGGYACDRLTINQGSNVVTVILADHASQIFVPRSLHGAVELDLPAELTGFPLRISRGEILEGHNKIDPTTSRIARILHQTGQWLARGIEVATEQNVVVGSVQPRRVLDGDFAMPEGFPEVDDIEDFERVFDPPRRSSRRSRFDWD